MASEALAEWVDCCQNHMQGVLKSHVINMHLLDLPRFHIAIICIMRIHIAVPGNRCLAHIPTCGISGTSPSRHTMSTVDQLVLGPAELCTICSRDDVWVGESLDGHMGC